METILLYFAAALLTGLLLVALAYIGRARPQADEQAERGRDYHTAASIEHWAAIFAVNNFRERLTFRQFMANPRGWLQALVFPRDTALIEEDFLPLLPAQRVIQERVLLEDLQREEAEVRQEQEREQLERRYSEISTHGGRPYAPMHRRKQSRKWQTRGHAASLKSA